jgi:ankyrin repeat protein
VFLVSVVAQVAFGTLLYPVSILVVGALLLYYQAKRRAVRASDVSDPDEFEKAADALGLDEVSRASANGDATRLADLLNYGLAVDRTDRDGADCLMYAAMNGHADCVQLLLDKGANPTLKTHKGSTAVQLAENGGFASIAKQIEDAAAKAA